ncbi:MAG: primosomal protein N', partial [Clostridia bacterium]|nr:primosomal protein N' [Clostridia bacterium]
MLKIISHLYSDFKLDRGDFALVNFMRARYFCTFFDCAACMLPPGIWGKAVDGQIKGVVNDKLIKNISLNMSYDEAVSLIGKGKSAQKRQAVLDCFIDFESLPEKELMYLTGVSQSVIKGLCEKDILKVSYEEVYRRPIFKKADDTKLVLSESQQEVFEKLNSKMNGKPSVSLLFGVTGSGKTEVYIRLIEEALKKGKTAMMLVPEIALTPQMVSRLCKYFGEKLALMHSMLSTSQRYDEYKRVMRGEATVVIGTRSAVFAPVKNLGVIIIDEEHEYSYKSESAPKYSAIDIAKYLANKNNALLVLGSATPSVESYYNAKTGRYDLVELKNRYGDTPLPDVYVADMRQKTVGEDEKDLSTALACEIASNMDKKEQTILFVNRRGNSGKLACVDCGHIPQCEHCSVALTYHSRNNRLMCHYCNYSEPMFKVCPSCGSRNIKEIGMGTQRAEEVIKERFPDAKVIRMDADTTTQRVTHEKILEDFDKNGDVLVGTQMVTKGLDFDNVTLVGVLDSDISLYSGDFRASARTFSLLSQVVGRAGRRNKKGRAVIQTYSPEHPVIKAAAKQDYEAFYNYEIGVRNMLELPPYCDIFLFTVTGDDEVKTMKAALRVSATLEKAFKEAYKDVYSEVLGPVAPGIYKINDKYRYNISFRGKDNKRTRDLISSILMG